MRSAYEAIALVVFLGAIFYCVPLIALWCGK